MWTYYITSWHFHIGCDNQMFENFFKHCLTFIRIGDPLVGFRQLKLLASEYFTGDLSPTSCTNFIIISLHCSLNSNCAFSDTLFCSSLYLVTKPTIMFFGCLYNFTRFSDELLASNTSFSEIPDFTNFLVKLVIRFSSASFRNTVMGLSIWNPVRNVFACLPINTKKANLDSARGVIHKHLDNVVRYSTRICYLFPVYWSNILP